MTDEKLIYEKRDGIAFMTMNRPRVVNCMDGEMYDLMTDAIEDYAADDSSLCLIITGAGENFSSGGDLKWLRAKREAAKEAGKAFYYDFPSYKAMDRLEKPVVSAVDGYCLGSGFNLAVYYSDIRVATERVQMGSPAVRRGLNNAGNSGLYPTPMTWYTGLGNALYMRLLGKYANGSEALRMGFVNEVVEPDQLMPRAIELAEIIKKANPDMVREEKLLLRRYQEVPGGWYIRLHDMIRRGSVSAKEDVYNEGTKAFLEKRDAAW
ncbi:hypothetical protein GTZ78_10805 [Streptomyces sp. SID8361]|uniref:enoyl-CoA hydratase/isomerase family protein n=1 Tax=Streptomyces sp. MnatMP-M27 TaxID=1839768 RepID=UPI00081DA8F1|nr:enoyl-CoA hydratase/isomerase family protein [Streptomyces sp. MnatMP-M27]MYU11168.1 hypothetical protein [Streptomyces sp. SID8361]SCF78874.1 enoyl-CoA hydratase [Streptomyces sp. MnatMP-M27]